MKRALKTLTGLLLSAAVVLGAVPLRVHGAEVLVGDINADQRVNIADVARLYAHFQGNSLVGQASMDRADLKDTGWMNEDYVRQLYDCARNFTLSKLIRAVQQLPENTVHADTVTLKGEVVSIETGYDPYFDNISVVLKVDGTGEKILCHRMTGEDAKRIDINSDIQVTGRLQNYDGWDGDYIKNVRLTAGHCEKEPTMWLSTEGRWQMTVDEVSRLPLDVSTRQEKRLLGRVIAMEPAASDATKITVTIHVPGRSDMPVRCHDLVGDDIHRVQLGDALHVEGILRNTAEGLEYTPGCELIGIDDLIIYNW